VVALEEKTRDRLIRGCVAAWFALIAAAVAGGVAVRISDGIHGAPAAAELLSRLCVLSFVAMIAWQTLRRDAAVARACGMQPRVSAFLGTNLILVGMLFLTRRGDLSVAAELASSALILVGNALAVFTLAHLGRSFSIMAEARRLVSTGPYAIVRHPLYVAEQIAVLGALIQYASPAAVVLVAAQCAFQVRRMLNEEALLREAIPGYARYMTVTARVVPGLW
jgi:protein-S-isoprenylcysteine O-methyltransferase Ste14